MLMILGWIIHSTKDGGQHTVTVVWITKKWKMVTSSFQIKAELTTVSLEQFCTQILIPSLM